MQIELHVWEGEREEKGNVHKERGLSTMETSSPDWICPLQNTNSGGPEAGKKTPRGPSAMGKSCRISLKLKERKGASYREAKTRDTTQ